MSGWMREVGQPASGRFAMSAIARVGDAVGLAISAVVQALFAGLLSWAG
jgi:hypothetical protein